MTSRHALCPRILRHVAKQFRWPTNTAGSATSSWRDASNQSQIMFGRNRSREILIGSVSFESAVAAML